MKKRMISLLCMALAVAMILPCMASGHQENIVYAEEPVATASAEAPTAKIVAYTDKRETRLYVAEMLEVQTTGFAPEATLSYTYQLSGGRGYEKFKSYDTVNGTYAYGDYRFFAITGGLEFDGTMKVTVKDTNQYSETYNKTVTASYTGFRQSSIHAHFEHLGVGMFEGETLKLTEIAGRNGVPHATCDEADFFFHKKYKDDEDEISIDRKKKTITAEKVGTCYKVKVYAVKYGGCMYHERSDCSFNGGYQNLTVRVFKKPTAVADAGSITLTNTEAGVTYIVDGTEKKCYSDGETIVFDNLAANRTYAVICEDDTKIKYDYSFESDSKVKVRASFSIKTKDDVSVIFNNNGLAKGQEPATQNYKASKKQFAVNPGSLSEPGYVFEGWYTARLREDGMAWDFDARRVVKSVYLYAQWTPIPNTLTLTLKMDDEAWPNQRVELYSFGEKSYTLTETEGVYFNDQVINGNYDIYVNGLDTGEDILFNNIGHALDEGQKKEVTLDYYSVMVETYLDNSISNAVGDISLVQNNEVRYSFANTDGTTKVHMLKNENTIFDVYINGIETGRTIEAELTAEPEKFFYYDTTADITINRDISSAVISLRNEAGQRKHILTYESTEGNTYRFNSCVLAEYVPTEEETFRVFFGNSDSGETVVFNKTGEGMDLYAEATYYRAYVTYVENGKTTDKAYITFNNPATSQKTTFDPTIGKFYADIPYRVKNGEELVYQVKVTGLVDNNPPVVSFNDVEAELRVNTASCTVTVANSQLTDIYRVKEGETLAQPKAAAYNGLKIENWYDKDTNELFDFDTVITGPVELVGIFAAQTVEINGYFRTDENGDALDNGTCYRMPNLVIANYPNGDCMSSFYLDVTGCEQVMIKENDEIGTFTITASGVTEGTKVTLSEGRVLVVFDDLISLKEMQQFLRENVIVKPDNGATHTIKITVSGKAN